MNNGGISPELVLREIARETRRKVRPLKLFDPTVCRSKTNPDKPWEIIERPIGDLFSCSLKLAVRGHKVTLCSNRVYLSLTLAAELDVDVCSINRKDLFSSSKIADRLASNLIAPVFTKSEDVSLKLRKLFRSSEILDLIQRLQFRRDESLHIYRNAVQVYLRPTSAISIFQIIDSMCRLAAANRRDSARIDLSDLPAPLKPLVPLVEKWGLSDDQGRAEMLEEASKEQLQALVGEVRPHLTAIDTFLDSFGDRSLSESAIGLGALAECVLEAEQELQKCK